jgi:precorrin-6A/cobalt-precorrin-6A reductase
MHARRSAQPSSAAGRGPRLWLIAGTGEGPPLAASLLARGWRLRVSVVSALAARAYAPHDGLELAVGALGANGGEASIRVLVQQLQQARRQGDGFRWVVDASHPFAVRITAALVAACRSCDQPLLRLTRAQPPLGRAELLEDLPELGGRIAAGRGDRMLPDGPPPRPRAALPDRPAPGAGGRRGTGSTGLPATGEPRCGDPGRPLSPVADPQRGLPPVGRGGGGCLAAAVPGSGAASVPAAPPRRALRAGGPGAGAPAGPAQPRC